MSTVTHPPSHTRIRFRPRKAAVAIDPASARPGVLLLPWGNLPRGTLVRSIQRLSLLGEPTWRVQFARGDMTGLGHWESADCTAQPLVSYVATRAEYDSAEAATSEDGVWWLLASGAMGKLGWDHHVPALVAVYNRAPTCVEQLLLDVHAAADRRVLSENTS